MNKINIEKFETISKNIKLDNDTKKSLTFFMNMRNNLIDSINNDIINNIDKELINNNVLLELNKNKKK